MIELANRTRVITPSMTLAISSKAKAMQAEGLDVCNFGVGEPDFNTPEFMRTAAKVALDEGKTKYAPAAGVPRLKELIADKLAKENNLPYRPEQVIVSTGGKQALFNVLAAIVGSGDEVLVPIPYWVSYPEIVKMLDATPVYLLTDATNGFKITPEQLDQAITDKTRILILNSPSNPTGSIYTAKELEALARVLVERNVAVISDEIYEKLIYDGAEHASIGSFGQDIFDLTITCNGFSKAYAATGWRLGYAAGPVNVIKAATSIQSHSTSGATTFAQYGAIAALQGSTEEMELMRQEFEYRRGLIVEGIRSIEGLTCTMPGGAFYAFPDISATGMDSLTFCEKLLEAHHVAIVPGAAFGADSNVRFSYATDRETIRKGVERLGAFVRSIL
ncbi:MAG: pyridoxal phosphate-dependent aminotransferase [Anaerolineales bacterium]|nr:pyridoxal phosphate-dependent aminotransferase [Anaerolineales bacterium]